MERIAVFTDQNGNMANFYDCVCFQIFLRVNGDFVLEKTVDYERILPSGASKVREAAKHLTEILEECKTVAFGEISGIPYAVFDREGFLIFSIPDYSRETLNGIILDLEEMKQEQQEKLEDAEQIKPVESEIPGIYFLDLLRIQKTHPELSTKQILQEFLHTTPFMELRLLCSHVPPWIARDESWEVQTQTTEQGIFARIAVRQCQEGSI